MQYNGWWVRLLFAEFIIITKHSIANHFHQQNLFPVSSSRKTVCVLALDVNSRNHKNCCSAVIVAVFCLLDHTGNSTCPLNSIKLVSCVENQDRKSEKISCIILSCQITLIRNCTKKTFNEPLLINSNRWFSEERVALKILVTVLRRQAYKNSWILDIVSWLDDDGVRQVSRHHSMKMRAVVRVLKKPGASKLT
jgi:hypothetical protein